MSQAGIHTSCRTVWYITNRLNILNILIIYYPPNYIPFKIFNHKKKAQNIWTLLNKKNFNFSFKKILIILFIFLKLETIVCYWNLMFLEKIIHDYLLDYIFKKFPSLFRSPGTPFDAKLLEILSGSISFYSFQNNNISSYCAIYNLCVCYCCTI